MECVRYSPTASSTAVTGPPPLLRLRTMAPWGTFQPDEELPHDTSEVLVAPASAVGAAMAATTNAAERRVFRARFDMSPPSKGTGESRALEENRRTRIVNS